MNLNIKFTVILLAISNLLLAQEIENALLWKVENDNQKVSYIYGTMHAGCDIELDSELQRAAEMAEFIILEIDLNDPNLAIEMMKHMYMKDEQKLMDFITEEEFKTLSEYINPRIANRGMSLDMLQNMKPILLSSMLIPSMLECEVMDAYDEKLASIAQKKGINVIGLESVEEQMQVFDRIPIEKQVSTLLESAKDQGEKDLKQLQDMINAYQNNDLKTLENIANEDHGIFIEYENDLLIKRNLNWMPALKKYLSQHQVLIGVGALHLVGEKGLINLLREEGFTVTPIK